MERVNALIFCVSKRKHYKKIIFINVVNHFYCLHASLEYKSLPSTEVEYTIHCYRQITLRLYI